jgi:uncharacterized damage-inducible protein DinB
MSKKNVDGNAKHSAFLCALAPARTYPSVRAGLCDEKIAPGIYPFFTMKTEIQKIRRLLERTFEKGAWHGPSVKETIEGVTEEQSLFRFQNTHSIIELVTHMTAWRIYVTKRLMGDAQYDVTDEMNFPVSKDWKKAVDDLHESQQVLLKALDSFPEEKLSELVTHPSAKLTFYTLLHGIIHHDVYHAGQIKLITKSFQ